MSKHRARRLLVGAAVTLTMLSYAGVGSASAAAPPGTNTAAAEAAACASLYSVPVNIGPEPLSACQWDMRAIHATSAESYAVNQGRGARIGDIDTGIDLTNSDIMPNVDVAASCVFLYADTPTANPAEQVTRGDCSNKAALQDLAGHGTHTAGTIAAPINGIGVVRRRSSGHGRRAQGRHRAGLLLHPVGRSTRCATPVTSTSTPST